MRRNKSHYQRSRRHRALARRGFLRPLRLERLEDRRVLAGEFTNISTAVADVSVGSVAWGDYDSDGDLDILLTGLDSGFNRISRVYQNTSGTFSDTSAGLTGVYLSSVAWGDYDNDGDLDILLTGSSSSGYTSLVYQNTSGTFSDIGAGLIGVSSSSVTWGDYDQDGDLDILLTGLGSGFTRISRVYQNSSGTFSDLSAGLTGVSSSSVTWGDYDQDGDLDILLTGSSSSGYTSLVYQNTSGTFSNISAGLTGVQSSSVAWGDYDNDGDLDFLLTGRDSGGASISRVYRNSSGTFSDTSAGLTGVALSSAAWGDYDSDGDLDILLTGDSGGNKFSRVYRNTSGTFSDLSAGLTGMSSGSVAWGDYDNDGDLDILLTGHTGGFFGNISRVYRNNGSTFNSVPAAPSGLTATSNSATSVTLAWTAPSDAQTPSDGLSYNLRVGTTPGGSDVLGPMSFQNPPSSQTDGRRKIAQRGLVQGTSWTLENLTPGQTYYWSVQALDTALGGSPFAAEASFTPPLFTDVSAGLTGVYAGSVAWGDYDNDGDLDILLTGQGSGYISRVYRNTSGTFSDISAGLTGVVRGSVAWGDYDNDGDLDILLTGQASGGARISRVYQNTSGTFSDTSAGLTGVARSSVAWGDYDHDGDLDILLTGYVGSGTRISRVYQNTSGTFSDISAGLTGVHRSSVAWGDYDNDGDLDILLTGYVGSGNYISRVYQNTSGVFSDISAGLTGVNLSSVAWGDYDNDGDLDILLTGYVGAGDRISRVYQNTSGTFSDLSAGLPGVSNGSVAWGDYDNDGDLDILLTGNFISRVYQNISGTFSDLSAGLADVLGSSVAWGDYDNDSDLDILLTGSDGSNFISRVYRNNGSTFNNVPAAPSGLTATINSPTSVTLAWTATSDTQTPSAGLNYNLRVGTTPGGSDVVGPMSFQNPPSSQTDGRRKIAQHGLVQGTSWTLDNLTPGQTYYWSVQALDTALAGSPFATESSVTPLFIDITAGLIGVRLSSVAWGDYDNDGDLDILLTGLDGSGGPISRVYQNSGGAFIDISAGLTGVYLSSVAWGDYDNDGDLDILLTGSAAGIGNNISRVYQNTSGTFSDIIAGLTDVSSSSVAWGDYDNDGDLDILLTGKDSGGSPISRVYQNTSGTFSDISAGLTDVRDGSVAWGDYDSDGDLDILLTGYDSGSNYISRVYQNSSGTFSDTSAGLTGVRRGSAAWGDYDNDGDLDILLMGQDSGGNYISRVYQNSSGTFSDISVGLTGVRDGSVAWGDYDNDGDLDILLTGQDSGGIRISRVYQNSSGTFSDISAGLTGVRDGSAAWGDYDNDGDLDILLTGFAAGPVNNISRVYRNNGSTFNSVPAAPSGLTATVNSATSVTLAWTAPSDTQTPSGGLSYNLRVGTTPGGSDIVGSMSFQNPPSSQTDGLRKIAQHGLVQGTSWTLDNLTPGQTYYWSVQAIDTTLAGGAFAAEASVTPLFTDLSAGLTGVQLSSVAWGDYDNDGDLDILLTGIDSGSNPISRVYQNTSGTFSDLSAGLTGVYLSSVAWGDYDNDGDLDILLTGRDSGGSTPISRVYQNASGTFSDLSAGLTDVRDGSAAWGDYDSDGDLDILLTGYANSGYTSRVYQNTSGTFSDTSAGLTGVRYSSVVWGDYDNDGDLDILLTGRDNVGTLISRVYQNTSGTFSDINAGLTGVGFGSVAWGDYDNDGDLDILLTGDAGAGTPISRVYQNSSGTFSDTSAGLTGVRLSSVAWGDYDNDGDLDILLTGKDSGGSPISRVYQNTSGTFSDTSAGLAGVEISSVAWGDYDNDGDLDILLTGRDSGNIHISRVYQNNGSTFNSVPAAPSGLTTTINSATSVTLAWTAPSDTQTPSVGLNYNLRVGTTPGGSDVVGPMSFQNPPSSQTDGLRKIAQRGLVQGTSWTLEGLTPGQTYYWSVQAIDTALAGSPFAAEVSFEILLDFGDAPDSGYPTLLANDGAAHVLGGSLFLGASLDGETDGQPNATATGDDLAGSDDENGVTFTNLIIPGELTKVTVNASVAGGLLDAWVDFNDDGDWAHPDEQIFTSTALAAGDNLLSFMVPAGVSLGAQTFARFRVSTAGGLAPTGAAADGEVEDYIVETCGTTVTNANNTGLGSLRIAIRCSNGATGMQSIDFNIPGAGPHTIQPTSALPTITAATIIDGTTEPDFVTTPVVELDGSLAGAGVNGLLITAGGSTVRGLVINRFTGAGIRLQTGGSNTVAGNYIGTDVAGMADLGNAREGVLVVSSPSNTIGGTVAADRNVIAGNNRNGVEIDNAAATGNLVRGNYIGTNAAGTASLGNTIDGVLIYNAPSNTIGGTATGAGNVISGNQRNGVLLTKAGTTSTLVQGNFIGTDVTGTVDLGNTFSGIKIQLSAATNTIGGTAAGARNIISGNNEGGVYLLIGTTGNLLQGNYIGTDITGALDLGNSKEGVLVANASGNTIGGTAAGAGNLISGNDRFGVEIDNTTVTGNLVQGNFIGTKSDGIAALGNTLDGVLLFNAGSNTIGGTAAGAGNVISGNQRNGLLLTRAGATGNLVQGNFIGTDVTGTLDRGNTFTGVKVNSSAATNTIGGTAAGARNIISGNDEGGVYLLTGTTGTLLQGNYIGTDVTGALDLGNTKEGVLIYSSASNTIGGTAAGAGNVISGNDRFGVEIANGASTGNLVQGNFIGTNFDGTSAVGNSIDGVLIYNASSNTIGGTAAGAGNVIADNLRHGVNVKGVAVNNPILSNSIFTNTGLGIDLNGDGVTANDANDPDTGSNNRQNFPVITSIVLNGPNLDITYSVSSVAPNSTYPLRVEFFIADAANQEGQTFLGSDSYTAPGAKLATIPAGAAIVGTRIVATATDNNATGSTSEFSANITAIVSLMAAGGEAPAGTAAANLTSAQLRPIVDSAIARLIAQGLTGAQANQLSSVTVGIADLPGAMLGSATSNAITLDATAAGYGWFIDPTPLDDAEFSAGSRLSTRDSQLRMDLLTAVMHELSHTLGLDDLHGQAAENDLMHGSLAKGVRLTSFATAVDVVLGGD